LLVISQDTSAYGVDVKHRTGFWNGAPVKTSMVSLCEQLAKLGVWVRLHYVYPYPHVDDVIPLMAEGKILPYLDIPLQHASPRILKLMKRPGAVERTLERIKRWREICPELTLRSTFIVGFPGETDEDFRATFDFLHGLDISYLHVFTYSERDNTHALTLKPVVPIAVRNERNKQLRNLSYQKMQYFTQQHANQTRKVLFEIFEKNGMMEGYTDNYIRITTPYRKEWANNLVDWTLQ